MLRQQLAQPCRLLAQLPADELVGMGGMAFAGTNTTDNWHALLDIALDGGTVNYADDDLAMDDGTAYDGRIASIPVLRLSTGALLDPRPGPRPFSTLRRDLRPAHSSTRLKYHRGSDSA
jgi:hypothetical protein